MWDMGKALNTEKGLREILNFIKIPKKEQENIKYLGQCLRSMDFILSDERNRKSTT